MTNIPRLLFACLALSAVMSCKKKVELTNPTHVSGASCAMMGRVSRANGCTDSVNLSYRYQMFGVEYFNDCASGIPGAWKAVRTITCASDGNQIYVTDSGTFRGTDTLIVNAQQKIQEEHGSLVTGNRVTRYEYDAAGRLVRGMISQFGVPAGTISYQYSAGDLIMVAYPGGDTIRYTYYPDKVVPESGYLTQQGFGYGTAYTSRNAHLVKSESGGRGGDINYSYRFGYYGNIDTMIVATAGLSPHIDTMTSRYICAIE